jgi:FkbM family methyltransferase
MNKRLKDVLKAPERLVRGVKRSLGRNTAIPLACGVTVRGDMRVAHWRLVAQRKYHEQATDGFLASFLRAGDVAIDVGAHLGILTAIASRRVGGAGRVVAFEVDDENFAQLEATIARNALTNVTPCRQALGDCAGVLEFARPNKSWGAFAVPQASAATGTRLAAQIERSTECRTFTVLVKTLDEALESLALARADLIKIDVDGFDFPVLKGAEATIRRHRPAIVYESSGFSRDAGVSFAEEFGFFQRHGYEVHVNSRTQSEARLARSGGEPWLAELLDRDRSLNLFCRPPEKYIDRWQGLWATAAARAA